MLNILFIHGSRGGKFQCLLEPLNVILYTFDFSKYSNKLSRIIYLVRFLYSIRKNNRFNLIITDDHGYHAFICYIVAFIFNCPFIVRLRGDNWEEARYEYKKYNFLLKPFISARNFFYIFLGNFALNRASVIIPVSKFLENIALKNLSIPIENFCTIHVPCMTPLLLKPKKTFNQKKIKLMMSTNFNFYKKTEAISFFSESFIMLCNRYPNLYIDIVGIGNPQNFLLNNLWINNFKKQIKVMTNKKDMVKLYDASDIFAHVSFQDAFPNVVVEAQSRCIPTIVNNFGGMVEQIIDNKTGLVIDSNNDFSLFDSVEKIILSKSLRDRFKKNAPVYVKRQFTISQLSSKLNRALKKL